MLSLPTMYVYCISCNPKRPKTIFDFYWNEQKQASFQAYLRIDRNVCSVHEEITSIRLYTPCNPRYARVCTTWL